MSTDQLVILCDKTDTTHIKVRKSLVERSSLLKQCLEMTTSADCPKIPISTADDWTLKKLVEWLEAHEKGETVWSSEEAKDMEIIDEFDKEWLGKMCQAEIMSIIMLANYLQVPRLLDNSCKFVARMISGKKIEEIRQVFCIKNDFTPEEEEQIRKENAWTDDVN